jgi:hypothetical protein
VLTTGYLRQRAKQAPVFLADLLQPDIKKAVGVAHGLFSNRLDDGGIANSEFYLGNHWQSGKGWIGAKPLITATGASHTLRQIEEGFVSENVIKEVVDRHVGGILGREPLWGFVPQFTVSRSALARRRRFSKLFNVVFDTVSAVVDTAKGLVGKSLDARAQEADEALTMWWDNQQPRKRLKDALARCLNEERVLLRLYVPRGLYEKEVPQQPDLATALSLLHVDVITSDKGGVFIDSDTRRPFAVYAYKVEQATCVELSYVNQLGQTVLQVLSDDAALVVEPAAYDMQGRLWMYELCRSPLITEQVRAAQKSLNLALTMLMRNVNLAGNLERVIMNAEAPKLKTRIADPSQPTGYREEVIDQAWGVGPGVTNSLTGLLIRDDKGTIIGRANPNISYRDPVQIETFVGTRNQYRECILGQAQQLHIMISGDSTVSGRSREQARAEYRGSLQDSKEPLDDAGRWLLESGLRVGAQFCNRTNDFAQLRCDFDSRVEDSPPSADDKRATLELVKAKMISRETGMMNVGIDDTDGELAKIAEESKSTALAPMVPETLDKSNGESVLIQ